MNDYLFTACIVHFNRIKQLKETVKCLKENTHNKFKIRILNQGYIDDEIEEYLKGLEEEEDIEIIYNPENIGCSPGRKIITQNITTPYIFSLDDDLYVSKDWDIPVMKYFNENSNIGAMGFSIYDIKGDFWMTGGQNIKIKNNRIYTNRPNVDPADSDVDFIKVDDISACCFFYKTELNSLVEWDEHYFIGFEDLEKGVKFKKNNIECAVSVKSKFIHDKLSVKFGEGKYNKMRRDYHAYRRGYLHFMKKNNVMLPISRHIFYKYVCILPNFILRNVAITWLKISKR